MDEYDSFLFTAGLIYFIFAILGLPLARLAQKTTAARQFAFNAASLIRETGNVGIALILLMPPLLTAYVCAWKLKRLGFKDPMEPHE